jgi:hypothetical protein
MLICVWQDAKFELPGVDLYEVAAELARCLRSREAGDSQFAPLFYEILGESQSTLERRGHMIRHRGPVAVPSSSGGNGHRPMSGGDHPPSAEDSALGSEWVCPCGYANDGVRALSLLHVFNLVAHAHLRTVFAGAGDM